GRPARCRDLRPRRVDPRAAHQGPGVGRLGVPGDEPPGGPLLRDLSRLPCRESGSGGGDARGLTPALWHHPRHRLAPATECLAAEPLLRRTPWTSTPRAPDGPPSKRPSPPSTARRS